MKNTRWTVAAATLGALGLVPLAARAQDVAPMGKAERKGMITAGKALVRITSPAVSEAWVSGIASSPPGGGISDRARAGRDMKAGADVAARGDLGDVAEPPEIVLTGSPVELVGLLQTAWATGRSVSGQIITTDYNDKQVRQIDFVNAVVTGFEMPALDAEATTFAEGKLSLRPESQRSHRSEDGASLALSTRSLQKKWLPSNFRLTIDGLDDACKRVNKIEALTIKQKSVNASVGIQRSASRAPSMWEPTALVFTIPEPDAKGFYEWIQASVRAGASANQRRTAVVELLAADRKTVLVTLKGSEARIAAVTPAPLSTAGENIRRVKVEMVVDKWQIAPGAVPGGP